MNKLLINALLKTGQLEAGKEYDFDFDHQYIETEKYDAKPTYKKFLDYGPGVAVIGDNIVGIGNRDGNTNVRFCPKDTLVRMFNRLENEGICITDAFSPMTTSPMYVTSGSSTTCAETMNIFVKQNEQSETCFGYAVARKRCA